MVVFFLVCVVDFFSDFVFVFILQYFSGMGYKIWRGA